MTTPDVCPLCKGYGFYLPAVPFGHPDWQKQIRCRCMAEADRKRAYERCRQYSDLDDVMLAEMTFATFDRTRYPDIWQTLQYWSLRPEGWQVLVGREGNGKTHLLVAAAGELLAHDRQAMYVVVPRLLRHLRDALDSAPGSERLRLEHLERVDVLLLDDYGVENETDWAYEQLHMLLDARYAARRPTAIASNLKMQDWPKRLSSRAQDRTRSKVHKMSKADYRLGEEQEAR